VSGSISSDGSTAVYVRLTDRAVARTRSVGDVNIDVDYTGEPVGVEVPDALAVTLDGQPTVNSQLAVAHLAAVLHPIVAGYVAALPRLQRACLPAGFADTLPADLAAVLVPMVDAAVSARLAEDMS